MTVISSVKLLDYHQLDITKYIEFYWKNKKKTQRSQSNNTNSDIGSTGFSPEYEGMRYILLLRSFAY